ncbi:MAG TPA: FecR family protein, partial [bacterium]|nr:FecR family protein [bacterium]
PAILHPTPVPTLVPQLVQAATPEALPGDSLEYVFDEVKGSVLVRNGSSAPVTAEEDLVLDPGDVIVTGPGSEATLTLNENTLFHVDENSEVTVAQLEKQGDNGFLSRLKLLKGKVLSEVEKLGQSHSTFEVDAGGVVCGVRGTGFEVLLQGDEVHENTFHGLVEMRDQDKVEKVAEGHHGAFSWKARKFLASRSLGVAEKGRYQHWLGMKGQFQKRREERMAALARFRGMAPEERHKVLERWKGTDRRERLKFLRGAIGRPGGWAPRPGKPGRGPQGRGIAPEKRGPGPLQRRFQDHRPGNGPGEVKDRRPGPLGRRKDGSRKPLFQRQPPDQGKEAGEKKEEGVQGPGRREGLRKLFAPKDRKMEKGSAKDEKTQTESKEKGLRDRWKKKDDPKEKEDKKEGEEGPKDRRPWSRDK